MLRIGDFSKLARVSIRMLRHYDEIGLLTPQNTDSDTGYRYYSEAQLPTANRITALKDMGFGLTLIGEVIKNYDRPDELERYLLLKETELKLQVDETQQRLLFLSSAIKRLREGDTMKYDVTLKTIPERYVASVRKIIPAYEQEGMLWGTLMQETAPLNIVDAETCYTLAIFHDGEHKESNVDVEVQKSVKGSYANTSNVVFKTEPAVLIASATFKGSYENANDVNNTVANWVQDNGYSFNGLSFMIYHVSPYETENPDEYVTEVCYPVSK